MTTELIIVSIGCVISLLNLLSTIFLSNAVFRLLIKKESQARTTPQKDGGLVDLPEIPTYDPRFLNSKN